MAVVNKIARIIGKIEAGNGIIYPIDALLIKPIPDVLKLFDYGNFAKGTFTVFEKAVNVSGLTTMLEDRKFKSYNHPYLYCSVYNNRSIMN